MMNPTLNLVEPLVEKALGRRSWFSRKVLMLLFLLAVCIRNGSRQGIAIQEAAISTAWHSMQSAKASQSMQSIGAWHLSAVERARQYMQPVMSSHFMQPAKSWQFMQPVRNEQYTRSAVASHSMQPAANAVPLPLEHAVTNNNDLLQHGNHMLQSMSTSVGGGCPGESGQVTALTGLNEFLSAQSCYPGRIIIFKFYAPWCRACKAMGAKLAKIAEEFPEARFFEVSFDDNKDLIKSLGIKKLPFVEIKRGTEELEAFPCGPAKVPMLKEKLLNLGLVTS
eukprot:gnl/TRDRNA2_/TRDRNA2_191898_c0_seq1.p1 gnl/TRDRNA2_/TRDRNA2_191898_c0~~gnl/TRDRNA2_/TRDRNA2_191898_c0_seq1.p1  ORF type:complete len:280 (-),score=47.24 gnl/TRDRNA2_/TRDRNA2_191898_c0_seq1:165-1004(-)